MATLRAIGKMNTGLRVGARGRAILMLAVLLAVGAGFSLANAPLASSAATVVMVTPINQAIPTDPQSPLWEKAPEVAVPLASQQIYQPGGGSTREVRVRSYEDGQNIAIRVSWDDDTRNDTVGSVPSDSAAIQLPSNPASLPYQCMGQSTNRVNIWQWKAALEKQGQTNLGALPVEDAGIRNLTSDGICKAVDTPGAQPHVQSYHDGKQWHVVFYRALDKAGAGTAPIVLGSNTSIAFAVWNGAKGEVRSMKAVSTWNTLQFPTEQPNNTGSLITLGVIIILSASLVGYFMRRMAG